jgi:hypothetical protein
MNEPIFEGNKMVLPPRDGKWYRTSNPHIVIDGIELYHWIRAGEDTPEGKFDHKEADIHGVRHETSR